MAIEELLTAWSAKAAAEGYELERVEFSAAEVAKWKEIAGEPLYQEWLEEMESLGLPGQEILNEAQRLRELYSS